MSRAAPDVRSLMSRVYCPRQFDRVDWRSREWRALVASSRVRTLKSGLIQIVAEILERLSREGVLARDEAWEYLANAREAWKSRGGSGAGSRLAEAPAEIAVDGDEDATTAMRGDGRRGEC